MTIQTFDIETGMPVYTSSGEKIGVVTEVQGFGSTLMASSPDQATTGTVTQASSGTGFFKVGGEGAVGTDSAEQTLAFNRIREVSADHGVVLTDEVVQEAPTQAIPAAAGPERHWWQMWRRSDRP